jgi:hypothetical protein
MPLPKPAKTIFGAWTQASEENADLETRLKERAFSVKDAPYSAIGDGVADDTVAILAADADATIAGGDVFFPPGVYKTSKNLVVSRRWYGVPLVSIIRPTAAVGKCLDVRTNGAVDGMYLDGVDTSGSTGIDVGTADLVNLMLVRDTQIWRFAGVGGRGIKLGRLVTGRFENVYTALNYINLHTNGGDTPTDTLFDNCQFRQAKTKGVWIETGLGLRFTKPLFESNGEEGLYFRNVGGAAAEISVDGAWYESNWQSIPSGARHAKYQLHADGSNGPAGTIRFAQTDCKFAEGTAGPRAMHLTNVTGFKDNNCKVSNEAGQILFDGTSYGNFESWNSQNGPFLTTVTDVSGGAWNSRSHLEDTIESAWTDWAPTLTAGTMKISSAVITKARYKIVGKTCTIAMTLGFATAGRATAAVSATLPTHVRSLDANLYNGCWIDDGAYHDGYVRPDGASPTSSIIIGRRDGADWGLGTLRAANFVLTFELS